MGNTTLPLTRPEMPAQPGVSLADKIASLKWGQNCEWQDYDCSGKPGNYRLNWEFGLYGTKKNHRRFETIEELESFLRERGVDPSAFSVQWDRDLFNGM